MSEEPFSAVLMAGGKSSRMGLDKAGLEIDGVPLWKRQVEILAQTGADEILISGDPKATWEGWTGPVVADDEPGVGPLSGLIVALRRARFPLLLVLAVDMPAMTVGVLQRLVQRARPPGGGVVPVQGNQFYEPLAAVYPREALGLAETCRAEGRLALQGFTAEAVRQGLMREDQIASGDEGCFVNLNTPQDWMGFVSSQGEKYTCRDTGEAL